MARAHCLMVPRDPTTGTVLTSATVNVYQPGTTTAVPGPLFDRAGAQLANPLTADAQTGLIDFYLNVAQDVDLNIVKSGFVTRTYFNVPVLDAASNELTSLLTTTGDMLYASAANTPARLPLGAANGVIQNFGGAPAWRTTLAGLTLTAPTVSDLTNAQHAHDTAAHGGQVSHFNLGNIGTNTHGAIDTHIASLSQHGVSGQILGTSDVQDISNKTFGIGNSIPLGRTLTVIGQIEGGTIANINSGPFTNDWFRNNIAGAGIMNQAINRGAYFDALGFIDFPNGWRYWHSNNMPASGNGANQTPISNGTVSATLNADLLDGYHHEQLNSGPVGNGQVCTFDFNLATVNGSTVFLPTLAQLGSIPTRRIGIKANTGATVTVQAQAGYFLDGVASGTFVLSPTDEIDLTLWTDNVTWMIK